MKNNRNKTHNISFLQMSDFNDLPWRRAFNVSFVTSSNSGRVLMFAVDVSNFHLSQKPQILCITNTDLNIVFAFCKIFIWLFRFVQITIFWNVKYLKIFKNHTLFEKNSSEIFISSSSWFLLDHSSSKYSN